MMKNVWDALKAEIVSYLRSRGLDAVSIGFVEEGWNQRFACNEVLVPYVESEGKAKYWSFQGTFYEFMEEMEGVERGEKPCI